MAEDTDDTIQIQGVPFPYTFRYEEGHPLTATEADVLDQTLNENLRNNFAGRVKAARKEHNVEDDAPLPQDVHDALLADFETYRNDYVFGVRQARGGAGGDPVKSAAMTMARQAIRDALRQAGKKVKEVPSDHIEAAAEKLIAGDASFMEKARAAVEERKANAAAALASLSGGVAAQDNGQGPADQAAA